MVENNYFTDLGLRKSINFIINNLHNIILNYETILPKIKEKICNEEIRLKGYLQDNYTYVSTDELYSMFSCNK